MSSLSFCKSIIVAGLAYAYKVWFHGEHLSMRAFYQCPMHVFSPKLVQGNKDGQGCRAQCDTIVRHRGPPGPDRCEGKVWVGRAQCRSAHRDPRGSRFKGLLRTPWWRPFENRVPGPCKKCGHYEEKASATLQVWLIRWEASPRNKNRYRSFELVQHFYGIYF